MSLQDSAEDGLANLSTENRPATYLVNPAMEVVMSAVAGELMSRFVSFLLNKYNCLRRPRLEERVEERLQHLLMRVCTIVEDADTRYITNSGMMMQLKTLSDAMYRGYTEQDNLRYRALQDGAGFDEVSSNDSYLAKRSRRTDKPTHLEPHDALDSLEMVVTNMAEFVSLLSGCERISRRPYDVYLYTENFMFGRHAEKQKLLSFLLQHNHAGDALAVLPIIGGAEVGKKTLVAHVCGDERVRSRYSSVLHLNEDSILSHGNTMFGMRMLVVIEFASDVRDDDWKKFHSFVKRMGRGSKIIIITKLKRLARFGSVKPVFLSVMSYDELRYLFKTLAFGSIDPTEHPLLLQIADEVAKELHTQGSLVRINAYADLLRKNLNVQFWRCILDKGRRMVKRNIFLYGVHPSMLIEQGHTVDMTDLASHPLSMSPYTVNASMKESPSVTFGDLLTDPRVRPKEDFILIMWESRVPPHNSFARFVTSRAQDRNEGTSSMPGRKRRGVPF